MRRLARQSREDSYASNRDYQEIFERDSLALHPSEGGDAHVVLRSPLEDGAGTKYVGAGGFVYAPKATLLRLRLTTSKAARERAFELRRGWNRVALALEDSESNEATAELEWPGDVELSLWGFAAGRVILPDPIAESIEGPEDLEQSHLAPETLYFDHEAAIGLDIVEDESTKFNLADGERITIKKCSYCGRMLPLDPRKPGLLSFHKHNAKRTGHQNECRACKKWRINDSFNPLRTVDQLHESSVITRERKLFLREPEILQAIKDRTEIGLKSLIWNRFGRSCFYCGKELSLDEVHLDHTRPMAYLWPIDEHASCLCAEHNNLKKDKFPVDFYNGTQLEKLSKLTGLSMDQLRQKELNQAELERILSDLPRFAREWEPRHFAATARKIAELRPEIALYELLKQEDESTHAWLIERLEMRPPAVGEIPE
jgi:hypothetical protein